MDDQCRNGGRNGPQADMQRFDPSIPFSFRNASISSTAPKAIKISSPKKTAILSHAAAWALILSRIVCGSSRIHSELPLPPSAPAADAPFARGRQATSGPAQPFLRGQQSRASGYAPRWRWRSSRPSPGAFFQPVIPIGQSPAGSE